MHLKLKGFEGAIIHSSFATTCLFGGKNLMNISRYIRGSADKWVHSRQKDFNDWRGAKIPTYNKQYSLTAKKVLLIFLSRIPFKKTKNHLYIQISKAQKVSHLMKKGSVKKRLQKLCLTINQDAQLSKIYHLLNIRCGHVVRDFESEAKTRCNFQFR